MHSRLFVRLGGALRRDRIRDEEEARPASEVAKRTPGAAQDAGNAREQWKAAGLDAADA
jgi:phage tail tape-measure protein